MTNKSYEFYVKEGKSLLEKIGVYQLKIARYASDICTIRHGGRSNGFYTITDYAKDIGMNAKTLQNWIQTYKAVILKLDVEINTPEGWAKASKVNTMLKNERTFANQEAGKPKTRFSYKQDVPKEKVNFLFQSLEEKPFIAEFAGAKQSAKHIKYLVEKRDLSMIEFAQLSDMMAILDSAADTLNEFLTKQKKKAA